MLCTRWPDGDLTAILLMFSFISDLIKKKATRVSQRSMPYVGCVVFVFSVSCSCSFCFFSLFSLFEAFLCCFFLML